MILLYYFEYLSFSPRLSPQRFGERAGLIATRCLGIIHSQRAYHGPNVIPPTSASEIAEMALRARGLSGSSADYIRSVANRLMELGIEDPAVTDLCTALVKATR